MAAEPTPSAATFALTPFPPSKVAIDQAVTQERRQGFRGMPQTDTIIIAALMIKGGEFKN